MIYSQIFYQILHFPSDLFFSSENFNISENNIIGAMPESHNHYILPSSFSTSTGLIIHRHKGPPLMMIHIKAPHKANQ
jgi:hypothetical protein